MALRIIITCRLRILNPQRKARKAILKIEWSMVSNYTKWKSVRICRGSKGIRMVRCWVAVSILMMGRGE